MLLVMFQSAFSYKTFSTTSEDTLERLGFSFPQRSSWRWRANSYWNGFLQFPQQKPLVTTGSGCFFLICLFISSLLAKVLNWTMWTANTMFCASTAFYVSMEMGWMLVPNTTLNTLLSKFIHDSIRTRICEQFNTLKWNEVCIRTRAFILLFLEPVQSA